MKRIAWLLLAMLGLALGIWAGNPPPVSVSAAGAYDFLITQYDVEMTVAENREIAVEERIAVSFTGYDSHGIIRDFVLSDGVRYRDISAECDSSDFDPFFQTDDVSMLSLYLRGDGRTTNESRVYTIRYTMIVPKLEEGYLPLDVIGYGWQADIENVTVRVHVPDGLRDYKIYSGYAGTRGDDFTDGGSRDGNDLVIRAETLSKNRDTAAGITLDLQFDDGVLKNRTDSALIWILLIGAVLIVIAVLLKAFYFKNPVITKTVNLTAPEEMDPLKMGKLIDNVTDGEDLGAAIFYLADQGYVDIDLTNEKNPTLIRTKKAISPDLPSYFKTMLKGLFKNGKAVTASALNNSFYQTAEVVKKGVSASAGGIYDKKGAAFIVLLGILTVGLLGGYLWVTSRISVGLGYQYWAGFVFCLLTFFISAVSFGLAKQYENKWKKGRRIAVCVIGFLIAVLLSLFSLVVYNAGFSPSSVMIASLLAAVCGGISGLCLVYTKEHSARLGHILGFKQFILYTERDKIEFMLKENPELYYHILPYAQVLGVSDAWTDKFKGLDMRPPVYMRNNSSLAFDLVVWNSMFRSMNKTMAANMISKPSSSGSGVNGGGGFGGGFGGGGFGGGGGRGC